MAIKRENIGRDQRGRVLDNRTKGVKRSGSKLNPRRKYKQNTDLNPNPGGSGKQARALDVIITEIHWNPSQALGQAPDIDWEYITIKNISGAPIDMFGWKFASAESTGTEFTRLWWNCDYSAMWGNGCYCNTGPTWDHSGMYMCPGAKWTIVTNPNQYGGSMCYNKFSTMNQYEWHTENNGTYLRLYNSGGTLIDEVLICGPQDWCGDWYSPGSNGGAARMSSENNPSSSFPRNVDESWQWVETADIPTPVFGQSVTGDCEGGGGGGSNNCSVYNLGYTTCGQIGKECCQMAGSSNYVCVLDPNCSDGFGGTNLGGSSSACADHLDNPWCDCSVGDFECGIWGSGGTCDMGGWAGESWGGHVVGSVPDCVISGTGYSARRGLCSNNPCNRMSSFVPTKRGHLPTNRQDGRK